MNVVADRFSRPLARYILPFVAATVLTACSSVDSGSDAASQSPADPAATPAPSTTGSAAVPNRAPVVSGTPASSAAVGVPYSFQPTASDPDGNALTFTIQNKPTWAAFSASTGLLSGTPAVSNVGATAGIVITVSDGITTTSLPAFSLSVTSVPASGNRPPVISGAPATTVAVGAAYSFQPTGSDPDGNALTYSIANKPGWATFTASTGRLAGTPAAGDVGSYANITISVSDGTATVALAPFSVAVVAGGTGNAQLNWTVPTLNTDGSALTTLSGYQILYGQSPGSLSQVAQVNNPSITTFVVENLTAGTWYFALKAISTGGQLSDQTNVASRVVP